MGSPDRDLFDDELVEAAGGLVWRLGRDGPKLAVIHRPKRQDWSLPKGKLESGERFTEAALREVEEETGCRARLESFAGYTLYRSRRGPKLVLFWHMVVDEVGRFEPNDEVDQVEWLTPEEALRRLDHASEQRLVRRAGIPKEVSGRRGTSSGRVRVA
jgi:8-oxo-dGTP diphosphatase